MGEKRRAMRFGETDSKGFKSESQETWGSSGESCTGNPRYLLGTYLKLPAYPVDLVGNLDLEVIREIEIEIHFQRNMPIRSIQRVSYFHEEGRGTRNTAT